MRDLQRCTGANIKLPQQGSTQEEETTVQMTGQFYAVQVRLSEALLQYSSGLYITCFNLGYCLVGI